MYKKITKKYLDSVLKDLFYNESSNKKTIEIYVSAYIDDKGNINCPYLEQFNKAIEEELNKNGAFASEEHRQDYINSFNNK